MITRNEVALSVNPPALYNDQRLKLGLFGLNCGGGLTMTDPAINHRLSWESNLKPVQIADRLGMEIVVPVARWRGFAGRDNFNGSSFETFTWAAALAASTSQIMLATTAHLPTVHPIVAAKQAATIVSVRARGVISGVGDGVFRGGACPTPECGVAGGHRVHRYGGVCTLQP